MQPFKRFRFVHNNKELNYPAIPEPDDFLKKQHICHKLPFETKKIKS